MTGHEFGVLMGPALLCKYEHFVTLRGLCLVGYYSYGPTTTAR